jgi:hypothetical protein
MSLGSSSSAAEGLRRRGVSASWALLVVVGLVGGALAWFPLVFAWLLGQAVAGELGWVPVDPTLLDDGWGVLLWGTGVLWLLLLALVVPLTWAAHRRTCLSARTWWSVSVLLWVTPFALAALSATTR